MALALDKAAFPDHFEMLFAFDFATAVLSENGEALPVDDTGTLSLPAWSLHDQLSEIARLHLVPVAALPTDAVAIGDDRNALMFDALRNAAAASTGAGSKSGKAKASAVAAAVINEDDEADGGATARRVRVDGAGWRLTELNESFEFCDGYPRQLVVPATVDDDALRKVGAFRSRHRVPACVYVHHKTRAAIARCAQPLVGLRRTRCQEDEMMLDAMRLTNPTDTSTLRIMDARPKVNADANRLKGGGYESYDGCQLKFCDIDNIHVMRDSLAKVTRACQLSRMDVYDGAQSELDRDVAASGWLGHVRRILHASNNVVRAVERDGTSVLLHCSDGWDRTAQLSALAQIMMEPYHRTVEGLCVLIAKEWLVFGHKFGERHGHADHMSNHKDSQRSPVFSQFLDCCWQLLLQFPEAFEFTEALLLYLRTHVHTSLFGTFLCNSESERARAHLNQRTVSLFDVFLTPARTDAPAVFLNSAYVPTKATLVAAADPDDTTLPLARVWLAAYGEGGINDKSGTYPDRARRFLVASDVTASLAAHHLCGLVPASYARALRRAVRGPSRKAPRRRNTGLSKSDASVTSANGGTNGTSHAAAADNGAPSPAERKQKRRDSTAATVSSGSPSASSVASSSSSSAAGKPRRERAKGLLPSTPSET
jgi:hypothetical protein